jgi:putative proteasome-type protease
LTALYGVGSLSAYRNAADIFHLEVNSNSMTFCLGIKVAQGLVALADTQITKGSECLTKGKLSIFRREPYPLFLMTSGLRSARDKAVIYFQELLEQDDDGLDKLYKAANAFGAQIRRVAQEDGKALAASGLHFNLHAILGGRLAADQEHGLFLLYPEGNWVEISPGAPYFSIGRTAYGKPILDRLLKDSCDLAQAISLGYLAFDATHASVNDVDFPLDVLVYHAQTRALREHRFQAAELAPVSTWWRQRLAASLAEFPLQWATPLLNQ